MRLKHRIRHTPFSEWRHYVGCTISFTTFGLLLVSFVTPYWLQSWSRIHTPFKSLGLWEFCMKGFVDRLDKEMVSYYDCWWILSPYYARIFTQLVPFWFLIIQVLLSVAIAIQLVLFIILIVYLCERIRHVERRIFAITTMTIGHAATAGLLFPGIVVFGSNYRDPDWIPVPKFNWPSWSFGCAILAAFSSIFGAVCFGLISRELRRDLEEYAMDFPLSTKLKHRRRWWLRKRHWSEDMEPKPKMNVSDSKLGVRSQINQPIALSELSHITDSQQTSSDHYNQKDPSVIESSAYSDWAPPTHSSDV